MEPMSFIQFKKGEERALSTYFERHARQLLLFAYRRVSDESVAEEVVQDAYVKLWTSRQRVESEAHIKSFLYLATRNACIDHLRRVSGRDPLRASELDENIAWGDQDLLAQLIHAETLQLIYGEVKKLPQTQQRVFQLTYLEGVSTDEICEELGMTPNAVFVARSKALNKLQQLFKGKSLLATLMLFCTLAGES